MRGQDALEQPARRQLLHGEVGVPEVGPINTMLGPKKPRRLGPQDGAWSAARCRVEETKVTGSFGVRFWDAGQVQGRQ